MKKVGLWIATCVILLPLFSAGQGSEKKERPLSPSEKMDKLFDFWNRLDQPGFAVVVVKEGQVLYQKVFGLACQEHGVAITPNTVFNIATAAKPFVGQAVALLEKQGKLSLDDDVRKHIPEFPDFSIPVKLRHLLFQTSGLRDWLSVLQLSGRDKEEVTFEQVLKIVKAQKQPAFPPGDRFQDSNTNYDLLAETIKRVSGRPFSDWSWENIFKPLKMTRTQFRDNYRSILDDQAFTYNFTRREYLRGIDNLSLAGSHSLFASIADLSKWLLNLETGQVGGQDIVAKMFTAGRLNNGQSSGFGYGLKIETGPGRPQVSQTGNWAGSGAVLAYFPDLKFGFALLANWDYTPVDGFVQGIIESYLPAAAEPEKKSPPTEAKKAVKVSPEKLDSYAGDYRLAPGQVFAISRAGDHLILSVPGAKFPLTALSETEFLLAVADARITFQKNKEGKVQQFVWKQGGDEQTAPKIVLVKPTPQELQEFAGSFFNAELDLRYAVELRGDTLIVKAPGQNDIRLAPDEKDHFTTSSRVLPMVIFQRDGQNRVIGFIIDSDPVRDLVFKKNSLPTGN
ncbi:MAG: serine hydrolase [Candidatus Aminicenantes bacterium]|nr:serine hydrolase [Candidatus Aminicenantes bacterium]